MHWFVIIIIWILFGFAGYAIGKPKNRSTGGFLLGFFLGIIGIVIIACLKPKKIETYTQPPNQQPPNCS